MVFRDVTAEHQIQEELQKMQRLESIGTLAGGIAHDFNNILLAIFANISMAKEDIPKDSTSYEFINEAEKAMEMAKNLANQLLTFAKGGEPIKSNVNIAELIAEVVKFDLSGSNVLPIFDIQPNNWHALLDVGQIQQVFSNLSINANHAMPEGGHLFISTENITLPNTNEQSLAPGDYVKIIFRDEGVGMGPDIIDQIFDPYFTTKETGNGLGLATTYSIIHKHVGNISVVSKLGVGSIFTIILPATRIKSKSQKLDRATLSKRDETIKILIMEDQKIVSDAMTKMLFGGGYYWKTATDGTQAIEMYNQSIKEGNIYNIVIMDLTIPGGIGGKEAAQEILSIEPNAIIVASSGYANNAIMSNFK